MARHSAGSSGLESSQTEYVSRGVRITDFGLAEGRLSAMQLNTVAGLGQLFGTALNR